MIQMWIHLANNKWIRYGRQFPFYGLAACDSVAEAGIQSLRNPLKGHGPLFTSTSKKVGYIADGNIYTDLHGKKIAKILRYKNGSGPYTDASACGGTVIHPGA